VTILDGATGTLALETGAPAGLSALWTVASPDLVKRIHREYVETGAEVVLANTFNASRPWLEREGQGVEPAELNRRAVDLARQAAAGRALVAGSVGPTPYGLGGAGDFAFYAAVEAFREQVEALVAAGVDLVVLETMFLLDELRAAVQAASAVRGVPTLVVCATFGRDGRMSCGATPEQVVAAAGPLGVDAVGANCSDGPDAMVPVIEAFARATRLPLWAKPNAGLPGAYLSPAEFASAALRLASAGATYVGGCCGTTPKHVQALRKAAADQRR
jgi:5-methyltetrahydrofolate--homocysteine methyltransferase